MADVNTPDAIPATNASNTTRYFNLPLFIATDKPSWLVDWNGAMGQIDTILEDIATASEGAVADVQTIQTQIDALNQIIPRLETTVQTAVEDVAAMQTTVDSHETRMDNIEQDLITQNNLIKTLSDAVTTMQGTVATLTNRVAAVETTVSGYDTEIAAIQSGLTNVQQSLSSMQSTVSSHTSQISSLDTRVTALEHGGGGSGFPALGDFEDTSKFTVQRVGGQLTTSSAQLTSFFTATQECYVIAMAWVNNGAQLVTDCYQEVDVGTGYQGVGIKLVAYGNMYQSADVESNVRGHIVTSGPIKLKAGDSIYQRGAVSADTHVTNWYYATIYTPVA